ncbi:MAG: hypothetical protein WAM97_20185, partial [Acidimicrobiales bacterium]
PNGWQRSPWDYPHLSSSVTLMPRDPTALLENLIWHDDDHLQIGDTQFFLTVDCPTLDATEPTSEQFPLLKKKALLQNLMKLLPESIDNMIELGIFDGGSIALYGQLLSPTSFVGIEIHRERVGALDQYLERHSATERVKLYYGTDQGDREALKKIVRDNFNGQSLDLVIDDCSHRYGPCKASLNTLCHCFVRVVSISSKIGRGHMCQLNTLKHLAARRTLYRS